MKRLIRWAVWIYPPAWRRRYQEEFEALLEDLPATPKIFLNTLSGAIQVQIQEHAMRIALFAALGAVLAAGMSLAIQDVFQHTIQLNLAPMDPRQKRLLEKAVAESMSRPALLFVIKRHNLFPDLRKGEAQEDAVVAMRKRIELIGEGPDEATLLKLAFRYEDPKIASEVADSLAHLVMEIYPETLPIKEVVRSAIPSGPLFPNRVSLVCIGLAGGILLGIATGFLRQRGPAKL
jgi:hypothetical protein